MHTKGFVASRKDYENRKFAILAATLQIAMIVLFALFVDYPPWLKRQFPKPEVNETAIDLNLTETTMTATETVAKVMPEKATEEIYHYYPMFQDVHAMIFVGFGFLMTFLKQYSYSSIGLNLFVSAFTLQWATLVFGFFARKEGQQYIEINMEMMINADFTAGTVLISWGALLGKTTPVKLLCMAVIEVLLAKVSEHICFHMLHATDVGGSMVIHAFGAYFGLAVALSLDFGVKKHQNHEKEMSNKNTDVFAMIGTIFLWIFWPSFNGALAANAFRQRAVVNTYFALTGAVVACFVTSPLVHKHNKFDMVHVQNASLAGGVAIGTCADMAVGPWVTILVGFIAGTVSVLGYKYLTPKIINTIHDTCGVHDLHGMPGIIGAVSGIIFCSLGYYEGNPISQQGINQIAALGVTLGIAIVGGIIVGIILRQPFLFTNMQDADDYYDDGAHWVVPLEENECKCHSENGTKMALLNGNDSEDSRA